MLVIFAFIVLTLASARLTRLVWADKISFPIRQKLAKKLGAQHWFVYLIHCPFCVSVWTSAFMTALGIAATGISWVWFLPGFLAMSYLVAPILRRFEGD